MGRVHLDAGGESFKIIIKPIRSQMTFLLSPCINYFQQCNEEIFFLTWVKPLPPSDSAGCLNVWA